MKVRSVNPGRVHHHSEKGFYYSVVYMLDHGHSVWFCPDYFESAAAAKQAMREKVAHERKHHGLEK